MEDLIVEIADLGRRGERAALASLIWSSGSIPMSEGAKMLIREDGKMLGTIGGGCLEAEILTVGRQVVETRKPHLTSYTMTEKQAGESGLNCGGTVRIYTEPVDNQAGIEEYGQVLQAREERRGCVVATLLDASRTPVSWQGRMLIREDGTRQGTLGAEEADEKVLAQAEGVLQKEAGRVVELELEPGVAGDLGLAPGQAAEVFLEPFLPAPVVYVFGGGHVGGQIGKLAKGVGFRVVVIDDRPMFANPARHPDVDECVVEEMESAFQMLDIDARSYIVAVTRGHQHDEKVIERAVATPARYIGMLGSERKKMLMWKQLEERGVARERLDRVYAPIGVNVGADTPEEIAVSVVAELIKVRRGGRKIWKTKNAEMMA